jgi:hypothetical protein
MEAHAKSLIRSSYDITDAGKFVASIDLSTWREKGEITTTEHTFQVVRNGFVKGEFQLKLGDDVVATALRKSVWKQHFTIDINGAKYELKASSFFKRTFELVHEGDVIVRFQPKNWFSRSFSIETPETLLPTTLLFSCWLVVLFLQRQAQAAAG